MWVLETNWTSDVEFDQLGHYNIFVHFHYYCLSWPFILIRKIQDKLFVLVFKKKSQKRKEANEIIFFQFLQSTPSEKYRQDPDRRSGEVSETELEKRRALLLAKLNESDWEMRVLIKVTFIFCTKEELLFVFIMNDVLFFYIYRWYYYLNDIFLEWFDLP